MEGASAAPARLTPPALAWPGAAHVAWTYGVANLLTLLFCLVYGGANFVTGLHPYRVRLHLDAELSIPLVPAATVVYSSVYVMFLLVPFVRRTRGEVVDFARVVAAEILVAGVFFLLLPAEVAFPSVGADLGVWDAPFRLVDWINLTYNLAPSLHATFAVTGAVALGSRCGPAGRLAFWVWGAAVCLSTVLTHQHHVVDMLSGALLALSLRRFHA